MKNTTCIVCKITLKNDDEVYEDRDTGGALCTQCSEYDESTGMYTAIQTEEKN